MIEDKVMTKVMPVISIETHWNILRTDGRDWQGVYGSVELQFLSDI